jgi:hypothetical protein
MAMKRSKRGIIEIEKLYEHFIGMRVAEAPFATYQQMCDLILDRETTRGDFE